MQIFFLASDNNAPSGGGKFIYRLAERTADLGYDVRVLHGERDFHYDWFEHRARVAFSTNFKPPSGRRRIADIRRWFLSPFRTTKTEHANVRSEDIVVLPENRLSRAAEIFPECRKVILCQNPFMLLRERCLGDAVGLGPIQEQVIASIGVSRLCVAALDFLELGVPVFSVPLYLDTSCFYFSEDKCARIAYMPRRRADDVRTVVNLLKLRGRVSDFDFQPIDNLSEADVGSTLRSSLVFLSFSEREGFGLPPAEAIACGCATVGFSGHGGDEFFEAFGAQRIDDGNVLQMVEAVEQIVERMRAEPEQHREVTRQASREILSTYPEDRTFEALACAWTSILNTSTFARPQIDHVPKEWTATGRHRLSIGR